ncbi:Mobile element protein [Azospirillum melinis]
MAFSRERWRRAWRHYLARMSPLSYARHQFPSAIIRHAIWLYLRFTLSYRDVEELPAERGVKVSYGTVRRWVLKFGPAIAGNLRRLRPKPSPRWHLDERVIGVSGRLMSLWRAVDDEGEMLEVGCGLLGQRMQPEDIVRSPPERQRQVAAAGKGPPPQHVLLLTAFVHLVAHEDGKQAFSPIGDISPAKLTSPLPCPRLTEASEVELHQHRRGASQRIFVCKRLAHRSLTTAHGPDRNRVS